MLELFPLTQKWLLKLPDMAVDVKTQSDTYKGLFLNEMLSLELCAKRNLAPATYFRNPDGSTNLSLTDTILDVSTFYLFAHKTLVSAIFVFVNTLPRDKTRGIPAASYTAFAKAVQAERNETLKSVRVSCGKNLTWARNAIIDKRDKLVQHWQSNASNKYFTMICAWDLPYLVYYNPKTLDQIDSVEVDYVFNQAKQKIKASIDARADSLQKIAWLEAWRPTLSTQLQAEIDRLTDTDIFVTLPVTPQLIKRLDETIACLLEKGIQMNAKTL